MEGGEVQSSYDRYCFGRRSLSNEACDSFHRIADLVRVALPLFAGTGDAAAPAGFRKRAAELADIFRRLRGASVQRARPDQYGECACIGGEMGLSDDGRRQIRDNAD